MQRRRGGVQYRLGQSGQTSQTAGIVQIGQHRQDAEFTGATLLIGAAYQRHDPPVTAQQRYGTAGDIAQAGYQ
ncbi:hypothetical protein THUN1379_28690 [Paludibacterium sp. THUN1379]|nr:hypothetical protein THUN1379_28690 [Paludibacterium sp. THUN1379]